MPNARLTERAPFFAEVDVLAAGTIAPHRVWGADVSETGMFLQTTHPFRIGDRLSLRFDCEDDPVHVPAAEVMWVRPFTPINVDGKAPGVGLKFLTVDQQARAVLRKLVLPQLENTTLPSRPADQLDALPPPRATLPPLTDSLLAMTSGRLQEVTDEMFSLGLAAAGSGLRPSLPADSAQEEFYLSLPPFSLPPVSPPPEMMPAPSDDNVRADEHCGAPLPATKAACAFDTSEPMDSPSTTSIEANAIPPHPLAAWSFRRDVPFAAHDDFAEVAQQDDVPSHSTAPLDLRFDDEAPHRPACPLPAEDAPFAGNFRSSPPTAPLDEDAMLALESAVAYGDLSLGHLPVADERRASPAVSTGSRTLPIAIALLCGGVMTGVLIGTAMRELPSPIPAVADATTADPALLAPLATLQVARTVAEVEKELVPPREAVAMAPLAPHEAASAEPSVAATTAATAATTIPAAITISATTATTTKTTLAAAPPAPVAKPAKAAKASSEGSSLELRVGDAKIVKAFTLTAPSRVVVDLKGARLPANPLRPGGAIKKVRFGTQTTGSDRVVIELEQTARASGLHTAIKSGVLLVTFR